MRNRHSNSFKDKVDRKLCQWFGHQWVDGFKFHNHKVKGESKVCQRCGEYAVITQTVVPDANANT